MPATYEPIASTTLGSDVSNYTFSSIPSTFTDLRLVLELYTTGDPESYAFLRYNSDTGANYSRTRLAYGPNSGRGSNETAHFPYASPNSTLSLSVIDIMSYSNTNVHKTILSSEVNTQSGAANFFVLRSVWLYRSTSAISSIQVAAPSLIKSGSRLALYGIKAA